MTETSRSERRLSTEAVADLIECAIDTTQCKAGSNFAGLLAHRLRHEAAKSGHGNSFAWWLGLLLGTVDVASERLPKGQIEAVLVAVGAAIDIEDPPAKEQH